VKGQAFYWCVIVVVFLSTVFVASEHHGQPPWLHDFLCTFHFMAYADLLSFTIVTGVL